MNFSFQWHYKIINECTEYFTESIYNFRQKQDLNFKWIKSCMHLEKRYVINFNRNVKVVYRYKLMKITVTE